MTVESEAMFKADNSPEGSYANNDNAKANIGWNKELQRSIYQQILLNDRERVGLNEKFLDQMYDNAVLEQIGYQEENSLEQHYPEEDDTERSRVFLAADKIISSNNSRNVHSADNLASDVRQRSNDTEDGAARIS